MGHQQHIFIGDARDRCRAGCASTFSAREAASPGSASRVTRAVPCSAKPRGRRPGCAASSSTASSGRGARLEQGARGAVVDRRGEAQAGAVGERARRPGSTQVVQRPAAEAGRPRPGRRRAVGAGADRDQADGAARRRHPPLVAVQMGGDVARDAGGRAAERRRRSCRARRGRDNRRSRARGMSSP